MMASASNGNHPEAKAEIVESIAFTGVGGNTYEYTDDFATEVLGVLNQVPTTQYKQCTDGTLMEIYDNQKYIDGEPQKKRIKCIAFVVIYE